MKEWVFHKGKTVGYVDEYGVYHTFRTAYTVFNKFKSFGFSAEVLQKLRRRGVKTVVVHFEEEHANYIASIDRILSKGLVYYDKKGNNDKQYHLPLQYFIKSNTSIGG
ncbi:MAG: hypothetical protein ACP5M7_09795 [Thermoproteota archaeon]